MIILTWRFLIIIRCAVQLWRIETVLLNNFNRKIRGRRQYVERIFIHGSPHLLSCTLRLFNCVFKSGHFPEDWTIGLLVPLHKKGSMHSADNSCGITLSIISKLLTRLLNNRQCNCEEGYDVYMEAQGGSQKNRGTTDSIFVLTSLM